MTGMTASITINGDVTDHLLQQQPSAHTHTHTHTSVCRERAETTKEMRGRGLHNMMREERCDRD